MKNQGGANTSNAGVLTIKIQPKPGVYTREDFERDLASFTGGTP